MVQFPFGEFFAAGRNILDRNTSVAVTRLMVFGLGRKSAQPAILVVLVALFALLTVCTTASVAGTAEPQKLSAAELSARIDQALSESWAKGGIEPAAPSDDTEFLRRIHLDLVGKIPSVAEVRTFLGDTRSDRRQRKIDELLHRGAWAAHFGRVWRDLMLAGAGNNFEVAALAPGLETWLRLRFATNIPYDQMVRELLGEPLAARSNMVQLRVSAAPSVLAYYQASERKPEALAASTSRLFLGMQVECAQCHDHPFSHWTRKEFWSYAAFFSGLENPNGTQPTSLLIPDTTTIVEASFLDGTRPKWEPGESKQAILARWMTRTDNPYFGRAAVNRMWDHFLGRGFVTPVDNIDPTNPAVHPELFDLVTQQFVLHGYDLKYLIKAIAGTRAYQLTSKVSTANQKNHEHFARMPLRRMSADQLFDSIVEATGFRETGPTQPQQFDLLSAGSARARFQAKFADQSVARTEAETSILQALSLMNGQITSDVTSLEASETLASVIEAPFLKTDQRIETLFLATLSRKPTADELREMTTYVSTSGPGRSERTALADVFWALLNSTEFVLIH